MPDPEGIAELAAELGVCDCGELLDEGSVVRGVTRLYLSGAAFPLATWAKVGWPKETPCCLVLDGSEESSRAIPCTGTFALLGKLVIDECVWYCGREGILELIVCVVGKLGVDVVLNAPYGCHCPVLPRVGVDVKAYG